MTDPTNTQQLQDELDALNAKITKQGSHVRQLKKDGAADDIGEAVKLLQALKIQASSVSDVLDKDTVFFNRKVFDDVTLRKMFIVPSFEIHGGVKGLFDLGPPATALKVCTSTLS
jgi:glycyl-tRNA synthetase